MKICCVVKGPSYEAVEHQLRQASSHADYAELRIDLFEEIDLDRLKLIKASSPLPLVFSLRTVEQGGRYTKKGEERLNMLASLARIEPDFLDLEYDLPPTFLKDFPRVISSYHHFEATPEDFTEVDRMLRKRDAKYYKIATMAHSSLDGMRMLEFVKRKNGDVIGVSMGEQGKFTRILSSFYGAPWTYAPFSLSDMTAPGQIDMETLLNIYRFKDLGPATEVYGLIGNPVVKSISHITHNKLMSSLEMNGVYIKFQVNEENLAEFLDLGRKLGWKGLSVTMPFKQKVLPLVDNRAGTVDAINTLTLFAGRWNGTNTDGIGAIDALLEKMTLQGKKMVLLGAGGAARAIAFEAVRRGADVAILNRRPEKARKVARSIGAKWGALNAIRLFFEEGYDALINTTPLSLPIAPKWIRENSVVMDINTLPAYSRLLMEAEERGCTLIFGHEMFARQALYQFHEWLDIDTQKIKKEFLELCKSTALGSPLANANLEAKGVFPSSP